MSAEGARQEALLALLADRGLGALIVTEPHNVRYLTGYVGSNGIALVGAGGRLLLTDSRYAVSARDQVRGAEVQVGTRDLLSDVALPWGKIEERLRTAAPRGQKKHAVEKFEARLTELGAIERPEPRPRLQKVPTK